MFKRIVTILFLLLANSVLLGHSIIIHHHHGTSIEEDILHEKHASEHFHHKSHDNSIHHDHQLPEHCHLFNSNDYCSLYISQLSTTKRIKYSIDYMLFGFEQVDPNNFSESKYLSFDLIQIAKSLSQQGVLTLRGPPIV